MLENRSDIKLDPRALQDLPVRKTSRPKTLRGPLHIQCSGHGNRKYIDQLVRDVLSWPHVETLSDVSNPPTAIPIRFEENAATLDSATFISAREFARVLLGAPTIYLALPLVCGTLGDRQRMGRATLSELVWLDARRSRGRLYAQGSGAVVRLLRPLLCSLSVGFSGK
jgi:hypothetical protein